MKPGFRYLLSGIVLVLLVAVGLQWQLRRSAGPSATRTDNPLARVALVASDVRDNDMQQLQLRAAALATDPAFSGYVLASMQPGTSGGAIDRASIVDLLRSRRRGYDLAAVLDAQGRTVAADGAMIGVGADLSDDPLVKRTLARQAPVAGAWVGEGMLFWVTVNPLKRGGIAEGLLLTAERVGDEYATTISRHTGTGVAVLVPDDHGYTIASAHAIAPRMAAELPRLATTLPATDPGTSLDRPLDLPGKQAAETARVIPLQTVSGQALVIAIARVPAPMRIGWLAPTVFLLGALAVLWHWWWVERPLRHLADRVGAVGRGRRPPEFVPRGSAATRRLARHLNRLFSVRRTELDSQGQSPLQAEQVWAQPGAVQGPERPATHRPKPPVSGAGTRK